MPTYDYVCHHCGHRFEVIHGLHEDGPKTCPVCHSHEVRKAIAAPTIHFKGSGWAKKDRSATSSTGSGSKTETSSGETAAATGAKDSGATGDAPKKDSSAASGAAAPASPSSAAD